MQDEAVVRLLRLAVGMGPVCITTNATIDRVLLVTRVFMPLTHELLTNELAGRIVSGKDIAKSINTESGEEEDCLQKISAYSSASRLLGSLGTTGPDEYVQYGQLVCIGDHARDTVGGLLFGVEFYPSVIAVKVTGPQDLAGMLAQVQKLGDELWRLFFPPAQERVRYEHVHVFKMADGTWGAVASWEAPPPPPPTIQL